MKKVPAVEIGVLLCSFFSKYMFCCDITATQPPLFEIPTIQLPCRVTTVTFLTWYADSLMSSWSPKQPCFWRMRIPHSMERRQAGHSPSTGRRCEGSDFRKYLARQITWELVLQDGWKQLSLSGSWKKTKDYGFIQVKPLIQIPQSMDYFYAIINLVVRVQKYRGQKRFCGWNMKIKYLKKCFYYCCLCILATDFSKAHLDCQWYANNLSC